MRDLRILLVEDNEDDAMLLLREIRRAGYDVECKRVESAEEMSASLDSEPWDIVVSDYRLPHFSAPAALETLHDSGLDLPFIIVSGVVGEETAVEAMKAGAHDYIMKNNMARLVPAIERELRDAAVRRERREAQHALESHLEFLETLIDTIPNPIFYKDLQGVYRGCNSTFASQLFGLSKEQVISRTLDDLHSVIPQELIRRYREQDEELLRNPGVKCYESPFLCADGTQRDYLLSKTTYKDAGGQIAGIVGILVDITDRKRAEREREMLEQQLRNSVQDGIVSIDHETRVLGINSAAASIFQVAPESAIGRTLTELCGEERKILPPIVEKCLSTGEFVREFQVSDRAKDREWVYVISVIPIKGGSDAGAVLVIRDISRLHLLERELADKFSFQKMIGKSPCMLRIFEMVHQLADTDTTVLVEGPSGTGKELVAAALHHHGSRKRGPLVKVNCAALPESLLESELFGHVRGAFTGATHDKAGRFEIAKGGTLFLDEIGDVSQQLQQRLLRVIQEREIERVGSSEPIKIDVRIIAATNRDLAQLVKQGSFREDLYYRLNVIKIFLPPLRERREDIPLLVNHFLDRYKKRLDRAVDDIDPAAMEILVNYDWPGNVRQLENAIEHAVVLCHKGYITVDHLPPDLKAAQQESSEDESSESQVPDSDKLKQVLDSVGWNRSRAARRLGVHRNTIARWIKEYQLTPPID